MTYYKHIQHLQDPLYVIAVISNSQRYKSRYKLYKDFEKHITDAGAVLHVVEHAFGDREFHLEENPNVTYHRVRGSDELWLKESLINYGVARLPYNWKYVAWLDADILFNRPDWVEETKHLLQHYSVLQLFSHGSDLGPNFEPLNTWTSFAFKYEQSLISGEEAIPYASTSIVNENCYPYLYGGMKGSDIWHPGFAWACTREAWDGFGGLIDYAVVGAADYHMAGAFIGRIDRTIGGVNKLDTYRKRLFGWQERCLRNVRKNIGFMPGHISHYWHGKKVNRRYLDRWKIIDRNNFSPDTDIMRDSQGIYQLSGNKIGLRDELRLYFKGRNEDSIDLN